MRHGEIVVFIQDCGKDNKNSKREDPQQHCAFDGWDFAVYDKWKGYEEHKDIGADVEDHLDYTVREVAGALWILYWECPVLRERPAEDEEVWDLYGKESDDTVANNKLDEEIIGCAVSI
jgi:hypothetical protein